MLLDHLLSLVHGTLATVGADVSRISDLLRHSGR
jgi:hypothetical protein